MDASSPGGSRVRTLPAGSGAGAEPPPPGSAPSATPPGASPPGERFFPDALPTVRSLPPLDPTAHLSSSAISILPRSSVTRPVLASECLRDDLAPIEPHDLALRRWQLAVGGALLAIAAFQTIRGTRLDAFLLACAALAPLAASVVRVKYGVRAILGVPGAVVLVVLAAANIGPLAPIAGQHPVSILHLVVPATFAAPLFLRATYRAAPAARIAVAVGSFLFLVAATQVGGGPLWGAHALLSSRLIACAMAIVSALSLLAFMGEETTGGCNAWGVGALLVGAAAIGADALPPGTPFDLAHALAVVTGVVGAAMIAIAGYAVGAGYIAARVRASAPIPRVGRLDSVPPVEE